MRSDDDAETGDVGVDAEVELDGETDTPEVEDGDIEAELGRTREGGRDDSLRHGIVVCGGWTLDWNRVGSGRMLDALVRW